jgi:magnesium-transporting ATPase (P-type)
MATTIYNQLLTDTQEYIKLQYKLLQVKTTAQVSRFIGIIFAAITIIILLLIGLIFASIALAAWLEYWIPMWASYLVITGVILLITLVVFWCRKRWIFRPIEKQLSEVVTNETMSLEEQEQRLDYQSSMRQELIKQDAKNIRQEWSEIERFLQVIRSLISQA